MGVVAAADALAVSAEQRSALEAVARSQSLPHRQVRQAKALLLAADGVANGEIGRQVGTSPAGVRRWRARFEAEGVESVGRVRSGRGRKPTIPAAVVEAIVADTLHTIPDDGSECWSTRSMAVRHGVGKDTVARIWRARKLRPWRVDLFKLSTDPAFETKLRDVVGLYVNPPPTQPRCSVSMRRPRSRRWTAPSRRCP